MNFIRQSLRPLFRRGTRLKRIALLLWTAFALQSQSVHAEVAFRTPQLTTAAPIRGTLTPNDPAHPDRTFAPGYVVQIARAGNYSIDLETPRGAPYDPMLCVYHDGRRVASNDDGGDGLNARISGHFPAGRYYVRLGCNRERRLERPADFVLTLRSGYVRRARPISTGAEPISERHPVEGAFGAGMQTLDSGRGFRSYRFHAHQHGDFEVNILSTDPSQFRPCLVLFDGGMREVSNTCAQAGSGHVRISNIAQATYTLVVSHADPPPPARPIPYFLSLTASY